jgi:uncharacterized membrane protein
MTAVVTSLSRHSPPRWVIPALLVSLAFNVVILAALGVGLWRHGSRVDASAAPHLAPNILSYASTLPKVRREELWNKTEDQRRIVRPLRLELREAREETLKLLAHENFDMQRYLAAQSRLLVIDQKAREAVHRLYAEIAANLTSDERHGYLRWREKRRPMQNLVDEPEKQANEQR